MYVCIYVCMYVCMYVCRYVYMYVLRPCPGPTGYYTPVPGRKVGRTQMEESKTLGCGSLNVYREIQTNTKGMRGQ